MHPRLQEYITKIENNDESLFHPLGYNPIIHLELPHLNLTDEDVQALFSAFDRNPKFIDLVRVINLSGNKIKKIDLSKFKKLIKLNLYQNKLSTINLSGLEILRHVDISHNQLTSIILCPLIFKNLNLSHNQLTSLTLKFQCLRWLNLSHNKLIILVLESTSSESLTLNLSHNELTGISLEKINSEYISGLDLSYNKLRLINLPESLALNTASPLCLDNNPLTILSMAKFPSLPIALENLLAGANIDGLKIFTPPKAALSRDYFNTILRALTKGRSISDIPLTMKIILRALADNFKPGVILSEDIYEFLQSIQISETTLAEYFKHLASAIKQVSTAINIGVCQKTLALARAAFSKGLNRDVVYKLLEMLGFTLTPAADNISFLKWGFNNKAEIQTLLARYLDNPEAKNAITKTLSLREGFETVVRRFEFALDKYRYDRFMQTHGFNKSRANINQVAINGHTPLSKAVSLGQLRMVKELIEFHYADPNCKTTYGNTPMHIAIYDILDAKKRQQIIAYLLTKGASLNVVNNQGVIVSQLAAQHGMVITAPNNKTPLLYSFIATNPSGELRKIIKEHGFSLAPTQINLPHENNGYTALAMAVRMQKLDLVKELVEKYQANINAPTKYGNTPLHIACFDIAKENELRQQIIEYLQDKGANSEITNDDKLPAFKLLK